MFFPIRMRSSAFRSAPNDWPGLEAAITPLGEFRTLPTMLKMPDGIGSGLDGFYAAVLRRVA